MHDVFISYSSKDYPQAETVRNILEKNDIPCWMAPRDIPYGSNYAKEIPIAIRASQVFVLIMSENAQSSQWVLRELDSAVNFGKVIFPFMLEDCQINDEFNFLLTGAQRYAAYQKKAEAMENLIRRIKAVTCTGTEPAKASEPVAAPAAETRKVDAAALLIGGKCPACGSEDLQELKGKIGKFTPKERALSAVPLLTGVAGSLVLGLLVLFITSVSSYGLFTPDLVLYTFLAFVGGALLGWYLGHRICRERIRRARVRSHIHPHPYLCNACSKKFLQEETNI